MRELATKTMTAASRIGSKRAVSGTMRSLLGNRDECRKLGVKLPPNGAEVKSQIPRRRASPAPIGGGKKLEYRAELSIHIGLWKAAVGAKKCLTYSHIGM